MEIDYDNLTLENFKERTGKRFRMTPDQKARDLTRLQALREWIAEQKGVAKAEVAPISAEPATSTVTIVLHVPKGTEVRTQSKMNVSLDEKFWDWFSEFQSRFPDIPNRDAIIFQYILDMGVGGVNDHMTLSENVIDRLIYDGVMNEEVLENQE
jgi:hypothetical protein